MLPPVWQSYGDNTAAVGNVDSHFSFAFQLNALLCIVKTHACTGDSFFRQLFFAVPLSDILMTISSFSVKVLMMILPPFLLIPC